MANELKHADPGTVLTQDEFNAVLRHVLANQARGDLIISDTGATGLIRLAKGSQGKLLVAGANDPQYGGVAYNLDSQVATNNFEFFRSKFREGFETTFAGYSNATGVVSGSGVTAAQAGNHYDLRLGSTHASTAGRYILQRAFPGTTGDAAITWDKKLLFAFRITWYHQTSLSNVILRVLLTQSNTITNLAADGLGLKTSGTDLGLATYGSGGSEVRVSGSTAIALDDPTWIAIEHDPASAVRLYINGALAATQSTTENIPTGTSGAIYIHPSLARSGGSETGDERFIISSIVLAQEL